MGRDLRGDTEDNVYGLTQGVVCTQGVLIFFWLGQPAEANMGSDLGQPPHSAPISLLALLTVAQREAL